MNKKLLALTTIAYALSGSLGGVRKNAETESERAKRLFDSEERIMRNRGLTKFYYGNNYVWALNQSSADKKAVKMKYI